MALGVWVCVTSVGGRAIESMRAKVMKQKNSHAVSLSATAETQQSLLDTFGTNDTRYSSDDLQYSVLWQGSKGMGMGDNEVGRRAAGSFEATKLCKPESIAEVCSDPRVIVGGSCPQVLVAPSCRGQGVFPCRLLLALVILVRSNPSSGVFGNRSSISGKVRDACSGPANMSGYYELRVHGPLLCIVRNVARG